MEIYRNMFGCKLVSIGHMCGKIQLKICRGGGYMCLLIIESTYIPVIY